MATLNLENSKFEIRNSKQIPNPKFQFSKHSLGFGKLEFKYCFGFHASDFGFYQAR